MQKNNSRNTLPNILSKNAHIDSKRREAIKDLKDLSLLGVGSILGLQIYKDSKTHSIESHFLDSYTNTLDSTSLLESNTLDSLHSPSYSNIPSEILSLPLKYFNVPQAYTMLLESKFSRNQRENLLYIVPLLTSKEFNHTMPSLYHNYNVENNTHRIYNKTSQFLQYHYDTLGSLLKDLQSYNFIIRDFRVLAQDFNNLDSKALLHKKIQEILKLIIIDEKREAKTKEDYEIHYNKQVPDYTFFNHKALDSKGNIIDTTSHISLNDIRRYQVPEGSSLYQEFKALEEEDQESAIDAYNEALEILADYKDYFFTNTPKKNDQGKILSYKDDKNKARRLLQCLNTIGQNNIRALYVGVNERENTNNAPTTHLAEATNSKDKNNKKRPKFIGRLATTIIIEDGLWLG
ncbi:hypothetical protein [Helicobacter trogontum]|uniref:Uncharacterized protein n=1 Tax=Helicobacter trogontum TaxID=50960 RepID=A0A4U8S988_9HELI|nr:hypothetical protein [Helicobacter trogontum]TLD82515.1 hypothetical protein LS81_007560 [Helicobacter trogontum]